MTLFLYYKNSNNQINKIKNNVFFCFDPTIRALSYFYFGYLHCRAKEKYTASEKF